MYVCWNLEVVMVVMCVCVCGGGVIAHTPMVTVERFYVAVADTTRYLNVYVTNHRLPEGTVIERTEDLDLKATDLCGTVDRVFTQAEIVTVHCQIQGQYVLIHQHDGDKMILCEVFILGHYYVGKENNIFFCAVCDILQFCIT